MFSAIDAFRRSGSLLILALCLMGAWAANIDALLPPGTNYLQNPSFETTTDDVKLVPNWELQGRGQIYSFDSTVAHSGKSSLKWLNTDAGRLDRAMQWMALQPKAGVPYDFGVWVKTENVERKQGQGNGVSIQIQWYNDAHDKLIGWYTGLPEVRGTTDWTWVGVKNVVFPPEAKNLRLVLFVFWGHTGTAWFDDVYVCESVPPALTTFRLSPVYRGWIAQDDTTPIRIRARLHPQGNGFALKNAQITVTFNPVNGRKPLLLRPKQEVEDITIPVKGLPLGETTLTITLTDVKQKKTLGTCTETVQRLADDFQAKVSIDNSRRLVVDGQPFFPLGMYTGGMDDNTLTRYADSAFNCLMIYGAPPKEQLDLCDKHHIKVIYSLNKYFSGLRNSPKELLTITDEENAFRQRVRDFRDHPALLAWYLNDEMPTFYLPRLEDHFRWLQQEDPNHPAWSVLAIPWTIGLYRNTADVIGSDPYPVPFEPAAKAGAWAHANVTQLEGARAVWMVPQAMNWAHYYTDERAGQSRAPSYDELRSMSWQCICEGATGLIYYTWEEMDKNPGMWDNLKRVAAEIKDYSPMLLSVDPALAITPEAPPDWLHWTVRAYAEKLYLFVANDGEGQGPVTFHLPNNLNSITVTGEQRDIPIGKDFTDNFDKFTVRIYEITLK